MTVINVMLGTGPLIIPCVFLIGGWIQATLFLLIMGVISLITCLFCVESLSIANALQQQRKSSMTSEVSVTYDQVPIN